MAYLQTLDKAFHCVMRNLVETGKAPHYSQLAMQLECSIDEVRKVLHELMEVATAGGSPAWVHPGTDWIASFCPFSNMPTQYRITVEGQQKWFGQ